MIEYNLTLTQKQADMVQRALDFYVRIGMGQWHEFINVIDDMMMRGMLPQSDFEKTRDVEDQLRSAINNAKLVHLGLHPNGGLGVGNQKIGDAIHSAYDLLVVLRNAIASAENHARHSVWNNKPLHYGNEPLALVTYTEKD